MLAISIARSSGPSERSATSRVEMTRAFSTTVSANEEKYAYSSNISSGGTESVICTSVHAGQKTRSSGYRASGRVSVSSSSSEFASGVDPSESTGSRRELPQERQTIGVSIGAALGIEPSSRGGRNARGSVAACKTATAPGGSRYCDGEPSWDAR